VPEVNPEALRKHEGFIANPNCSTIQMVVALGPLHQAARIKRVVVATYQAASGKGADAVEQLGREMAAKVQGGPPAPLAPFPHPLCGNVLPHIDSFLEDGYTKEEHKMVTETRKILGDDSIQITATTVRVPVENGHSEAVNVEFHSPLEAERARELLREAPGVVVQDDPGANVYPLPLAVSGTDEVYVGRIRQDRSVPYGLNLWVVADNLRKGAALNAVQIAEKMIEMGLL
jgi:aspartate-semialdehyde dehydrogenase